MVRAKVMQRSATTNRRQQRSADLCSKTKKRERTATATEQTELGSQTKRLQQDHGQTFELPQLAQLLLDVDQEQHDDSDPLYAPLID